MNLMAAILMIMTFIAFVGKELLVSRRSKLLHGGRKS
jgi:hypothetical protein